MSRNTKQPRRKPPADSEHSEFEIEDQEGDDRDSDSRRRRTLDVINQDDAVIVLNKPAGVWPDERSTGLPSAIATLISAGVLDPSSFVEAVYPLDCDASGVLLLARDAESLADLKRQIGERVLELRYLAIVRGRPGQEAGLCQQRLFDPKAPGSLVRVDEARGEAASTDWRIRESYVGFALLECIPRSDIRSQVRAHLQAAGLPLAVDQRYGGGDELRLSTFKAGYRPSRRKEERPLIARLTLHAASVRFRHPRTGQVVSYEAAMPKDMRATIHQLDRFGRLPP